MLPIDYISDMAEKLCRKYGTRDPYKICDALGVRVRVKDLGEDMKAYYFSHSRIRNIVLNSRVSRSLRRVLTAHELGHERLHHEIAVLRGFQELGFFDMSQPTEYEANIFAAELLIEDEEILTALSDTGVTFYGAARELYVPPALLDFKLRVLKHKGYDIAAPYIAQGDFLKNTGDSDYDDF